MSFKDAELLAGQSDRRTDGRAREGEGEKFTRRLARTRPAAAYGPTLSPLGLLSLLRESERERASQPAGRPIKLFAVAVDAQTATTTTTTRPANGICWQACWAGARPAWRTVELCAEQTERKQRETISVAGNHHNE